VTVKRNDGSDSAASPKGYIIEFVANGKAFASVLIDNAATPNWQITCAYPMHVECLPEGNMPQHPNGRTFRVCVPKLDYFEYVEMIDNKIVNKPMDEQAYEFNKKYCIKEVERGYIDTEGEGR
jgi:hypothetical protein